MLWRRLPTCTCYTAGGSTGTLNPVFRLNHTLASTSKVKVEDLEAVPFDRASPFQDLLPTSAVASSNVGRRHRLKGANKSRKNRQWQQWNRLQTIKPVELPEPRSQPTTAQPRVPVSQISPYLPVVTRERSHLLMLLRSNLDPPLPASKSKQPYRRRNADATWSALAQILNYPEIVPDLPTTAHSTSARWVPGPEDELGFFDGGQHQRPDYDGRDKIELSVDELRKAFSVFSDARPRTRDGLNRLLVVAELLAQKTRQASTDPTPRPFSSSSYDSSPAPTGGPGGNVVPSGRDELVRELPGGGAGLRERDWRALILFAGASRRAPRTTIEVESALSLFSQFSSTSSNKHRIVRRQKRDVALPLEREEEEDVAVVPEVATFNSLLHVARRARAWELCAQVLKRMDDLGVQADVHTTSIKMLTDDQLGVHIEPIWNVFENAVTVDGVAVSVHGAKEEHKQLWGTMLWIYARRGLMDEAMSIYQAMRDGQPRSMSELRPGRGEWLSDPSVESQGATKCVLPPPNVAAYTGLIQAFAHRGDLTSALKIMRDMASPAPSFSSPDHRQLATISPTPHMFACLFRGFARFGLGPEEEARLTQSSMPRVPRQLVSTNYEYVFGGPKRSNTLATARGDSFSSLRERGRGHESASQAWTIKALDTLFDSFLALSPPASSSSSSSPSSASSPLGSSPLRSPAPPPLPFDGTRTAPSSKELFWLVLAYEIMTDHDSQVVLAVWNAVERTFGRPGHKSDSKMTTTQWTGWRVDRRLKERLMAHERRLRALEAGQAVTELERREQEE